DLCAVLSAGSAVYLLTAGGGARIAGAPGALTALFQWLPLLVAPLVACQAYSTAGKVDLGAFFWAYRKKAAGGRALSPDALDLAYPYAVLCVLSAGAANVRTPAYFAGVCLLTAWALWVGRSPRFSPLWWVASLALASVAGYGGHVGLHRVQQKLEELAFEYISSLVHRDTDPFRSTTRIGHLGQLKLSDRILLRVTPAPGQAPPILLREATYNVYNSPAWFTLGAGFTPVQPEAGGETWKLAPGPASEASVGVSMYLPRRRLVPSLPAGSMDDDNPAVVRLSKNSLAAGTPVTASTSRRPPSCCFARRVCRRATRRATRSRSGAAWNDATSFARGTRIPGRSCGRTAPGATWTRPLPCGRTRKRP